jgi:uncharacterized protein
LICKFGISKCKSLHFPSRDLGLCWRLDILLDDWITVMPSITQPFLTGASASCDVLPQCGLADYRVLIVPGLHGSGPDHWQSRWQQLYPGFERVEQARWDVPDLPLWSDRLDQTLQRSSRPVLLVAHSFGVLTSVHRAAAGAANVIAALLVAPADPDKFGVSSLLPQVPLPFPSIMVGSTNDPWMSSDRAACWAAVWGSEFVNAGALGHVNAESDLGDWDVGQALLQRLAAGMGKPAR